MWQEEIYEKLGYYCNKYYRQGHTISVCRAALSGQTDMGKNQKILKDGKNVEQRTWKRVEGTNQLLGMKSGNTASSSDADIDLGIEESSKDLIKNGNKKSNEKEVEIQS